MEKHFFTRSQSFGLFTTATLMSCGLWVTSTLALIPSFDGSEIHDFCEGPGKAKTQPESERFMVLQTCPEVSLDMIISI